MNGRLHSRIYLTTFWPLVLLVLLVRISLGSLPAPSDLLHSNDSEFARLSVLCSDNAPHPAPDDNHHSGTQDESFLLLDALELLAPGNLISPLSCLSVILVSMVWFFHPIRGPPDRKNSAICPQGPPLTT